jgi:hypothetical protein
MRAGDIPLLVALLVMLPVLSWLSYNLIARPNGFWRPMMRFWSKLPGFRLQMYLIESLPLLGGRSRMKYYLEGTTGSAAEDVKIERCERLGGRFMGSVCAVYCLVMLIVIIGVITGNLHAE